MFQEFRRYLVDEIGVEPSSELVALDRSIASGNLPATDGPSARRVGAYDLHEPIGAGAFAVVHRATQSSLGREVAVKIIRAEFANEPEFIRRFEAEAQMVARIEHANIVPLYDYWREPDRALLAMRWMSGGSLASKLGDAWSVDDALAVVDQIAAALEAAHRQGVVHRDVKPENILFDASGRAHLGDFGIAVEAARALPAVTAAPGSPTFASPEQLRSEPVGPEADVYALAMVASLLLTDDTAGGDADAGIREVLAIATAERPADRYPSAEAFALALRGAASRPTTLPVRVGSGGANPFKGLNPFVESDAADFHGRDRLVGELVKRLSDHDRLLAVVGPSWSG